MILREWTFTAAQLFVIDFGKKLIAAITVPEFYCGNVVSKLNCWIQIRWNDEATPPVEHKLKLSQPFPIEDVTAGEENFNCNGMSYARPVGDHLTDPATGLLALGITQDNILDMLSTMGYLSAGTKADEA